MKTNDIISVTIKKVRLHKEERKMQGATYGNYDSAYVGELEEYPHGIVILNDYANTNHPDWTNKTMGRASIIERELIGKSINVKITDIFAGENCFEGIMI